MAKLDGLSLKSLKKHPSLIPLFLAVGIALSGAVLYPLRCALKSPDVSWNSSKNPEPWNAYSNKQYKFFQTSKSNHESPAPSY